MILESRLLARFLRYVRIGTAADPTTSAYPSSPGQWDLGKVLVQELMAMGADDVRHDRYGLVWGTIPSTLGPGLRPVAFANDPSGELVEGVESEQHRCVVGVQWHPERAEEHEPPFAPMSRRLFAAFVDAVRGA